MDSKIQYLLHKADQDRNFEYLSEAYRLLDPEVVNSSSEKTLKDIENFSQNLFIECAEKAISFKEYQIADRCLKLYFSMPAIANQFLARAYLCQFEIFAPKSADQYENLHKAVPFLFKSIDFSKQNKRYNFLIYNSSVIYWKYARAFLKPNFKRFLCVSLKKITSALKDIDDADYEWRVFLERTLVEAYIDNKQLDEANTLANSLIKFIQNYLPPSYFDDFFEFIARENLLTEEDLKTISASKWDLTAIYRIEKLKRLKKLPKENSASFSEDQILAELEDVYKSIRPRNKFTSVVDDTNQFVKSFDNSKKEEFVLNTKRQKLLIQLARLCLLFDQVNLGSQIIGYLKESELSNDEFLLEIEFIECEQSVKEMRHRQERYTKGVVKKRLESVTRCQEAIQNAIRLNSPHLVQLGCFTQWNLCLPLLQPNLRLQIRKPLQHISECLERIESMEWLLRCQIHFELAKCDEEMEQLQTAEQHLLKAIRFDDEKIYAEQLSHSLKRLRLRAELYKTPERVEDQAAMILEQCVIGGNGEKRLKMAISELLESLDKEKRDESSTGQINTHSLLLRAADLLAPNDFTHVLESETYKANVGKLGDDQVTLLKKKAQNYENCVSKGSNHLNDRLSDIERSFNRNKAQNSDAGSNSSSELELILKADYKERLKLWFDLSKIARKQQIWDICRVSCRFSCLYDNQKHIDRFLKSSSSGFQSLFDLELMRNLAEAHFIFGESLVQYIRAEGVDLFERPKPPSDADPSNRSQSKQKNDENSLRNFETDPEWSTYCDWLNRLSQQSIDNFLRGIQIGVQLGESWLVSQGSAYIWNYIHHKVEKKQFNQIVPVLSECLDALRKVGHNNEPELLVAISVALSNGLMQNWLPHEHVKSLQVPNFGDGGNEKHPRKGNPNPANQPKTQFSLTAEAQSDIKKAIEICENAMNITNGENLSNLVNLKDRHSLIKTWVLAKQLGQSAIKNLGVLKTTTTGIERVQDKFTKCMVGVEILNRNLKMHGMGSGFEIKEAPSIRDLIGLIDAAQIWPDRLIELELWSNLSVLASKANQTDNLRHCHSRALETLSYFEKKKNENMNIYIKSQLLLSEACIALGENLAYLVLSSQNSNKQGRETALQSALGSTSVDLKSSSGNHDQPTSKDAIQLTLRRNALNAFADAASYAAKAQNYAYVVHSARHFWNIGVTYLQQVQERSTLFENLNEILTSWQAVSKFRPLETTQTEHPAQEKDVTAEITDTTKLKSTKKSDASRVKESVAGKKSAQSKSPPSKSPTKSSIKPIIESAAVQNDIQPSPATKASISTNFDPLEDAFDDLTLRCVLYACFFQILIDRNQHDQALNQMEKALNDLPRTSRHRLLIYRFKVLTKSGMGLDVQMDLQKFREESEKNLAQMYRKVALSSLKHSDTIGSYQRAIETLNSDESIWLKFEYTLELCQWLYSNEYNLENCIDLAEWAADLVMLHVKPSGQSGGVGGESFKNSSRSRVSTAASLRRSSRALVHQQNKSQRSKIMPMSSNNLLPTIFDETQATTVSMDVATMSSHMEKNADNELDLLIRKSKRENLFEASTGPKPNSWDDFDDIKQLDCLIRVHTVLAQICGRNSIDYIGYVLKAYYSVVRLIQIGVENASLAWKEILKLNAQAEPTGQDKGENKKKQAETGKKSNLGDARSSNSSKQIGGVKSGEIPQTLDQWSQFEISEDVFTAWGHDVMKKTGINSHTISEPYLLFHSLDQLDRIANEMGLDQLRLPIVHLQLILSNTCFKFDQQSSSLHTYIRLKFINICTELNLINSVGFHQQALANQALSEMRLQDQLGSSQLGTNPLMLLKLAQIDPSEICLVRDRVHAHKQRLANAQNEEAALAAAAASSSTALLDSSSVVSIKSTTNKKPAGKKKQAKIQHEESELLFAAFDRPLQTDEINLPGEVRKLDEDLTHALYKDIWVNLAQVLVDNGFFQVARDYLFESLNACQGLDDSHTLAKVHYLLGRISLFDFNFIEARQHTFKAQKMAIDETFWYKTIRLLVDSHKLDLDDKDGYEKCVRILNRSINIVREETSRRKNKSDNLGYIEAMLMYELAEIVRDGVLSGRLSDQDALIRRRMMSKRSFRLNSMHPMLFKRLSEVCNMYQSSIELLISHGYKRESVEIIRSHARLLKTFANDCHNQEAKHDYLIQSFMVLNDGSSLLEEVYTEIVSLQNWNELQSVSLPIQRELIDLRLELCHLLTDILEAELDRLVYKNESDLMKDVAVKTIENFIEPAQNLNELEIEWRSLVFKIPDLLLSQLSSLHTLSSKIKSFKSQCYYIIGRTYRLVSEMTIQLRKTNDQLDSLDPPIDMILPVSKWNDLLVDIYKTLLFQFQSQSDSEQTTAGGKIKSKSIKSASNMNLTESQINYADPSAIDRDLETHPRSIDPNLSDKINQIKSLVIAANQFDSQAMECLMQAQHLAFQLDDKILGQSISSELIELVGRYDMNLCSQLIALYQSFSNALEFERIVEKSSSDPKNSLLTGCLNQIKFYKNLNVKRNSLSSPVVKQLLDLTKSKLNAFKYLSINPNHLNLSKDLPLNYTVVILQHNQSKTELYCSVLDRSKIQNQIGIKTLKSQSGSASVSKSMVAKFKTDSFELHHLKQLWLEWKADIQSFYLKLEFQLSNSIGKKDHSISHDSSFNAHSDQLNEFIKHYISHDNSKYAEILDYWADLEDKFDYLVQRTETYLRRSSLFIQNYFNSRDQPISAKPNSQPFSRPNERLIILADLDLMEFPLEILQVFHHNRCISSISRDFSLHVFATRLLSQKETESNKTEENKKTEKASKANVNKQPQPNQSTSEPLPDSAVVIDNSKVKYMIDIFNEFTHGIPDGLTPNGSFKRIVQKYNQLSSKWGGLMGSEYASSLGERENLLADSNCLLFSGTERFLSYFDSRRMASSNLNECRFIFANDLAQTAKSYNRIGKEDSQKIQSELECEQPIETTIILTLAGVKSIALNQWSSSLVENTVRFEAILKEIIEDRKSSGETTRYMRAPHLKQELIERSKRDEEHRRMMSERKDASKKEKKESTASKSKSPNRDKSPKTKKQPETIPENVEAQTEIDKSDQMLSVEANTDTNTNTIGLQRVKIGNSNMICFGLPDIYFSN